MPAERSESGCPWACGQSNLCPPPEIFHALPVVMGRARAHLPGSPAPRMKPFLPKLAVVASALLLSAQAPAPQVSTPAATEAPAVTETPAVTEAPSSHTENAPSEAQLSPRPDAEKTQQPEGFVEVLNPAFPTPRRPRPSSTGAVATRWRTWRRTSARARRRRP